MNVDRLEPVRRAGRAPKLHGVVVVHGGRVAFECYGEGKDSRLAKDLGTVRFGPETLHDIRSVTKSIVGFL